LLVLQGKVDLLIFQAIFIAILESVIISAITIFFSCVVVTTALTGLFGFAFYLGGRTINYLQFFLQDEKTPTAIKTAINVFDQILPDLTLYNVADTVVDGIAISKAHMLSASLYCVLYSATVIVIACLIFEKRELYEK